MTTRRNVLTILGLAGAGSGALASCDVTRRDFDGTSVAYRMQKCDPERMATALERLAAEIRSGQTTVGRFHIGSEAVGEHWLTQTLTIDLEIMHPEKA